MLKEYDAKDVQRAVDQALQGDDRRARRGAARYWRSWGSPLADWSPVHLDRLRQIVVDVMRESHYYPLRQDALRTVQSWRDSFTAEQQWKLVSSGLRDSHPGVRRAAMLTAGGLGLQSSADHLLRVLQVETSRMFPLPVVPADETVDLRDGFDDVAAGRPEKEVAALALGYLGDRRAVEEIKRQSEESPMYEVALALLGIHERLKPEHFQLGERNSALQMAALKVVIDTQGAHGLQWATEYQQAEYWWEEDVVAAELSKMLVRQDAPGAQDLVNCSDLDEVVEWFARHGEDYLQRIDESPSPDSR